MPVTIRKFIPGESVTVPAYFDGSAWIGRVSTTPVETSSAPGLAVMTIVPIDHDGATLWHPAGNVKQC